MSTSTFFYYIFFVFAISVVSAVEDATIVYIQPAFQWAQSPHEIFLNIKFAHKMDTPATLNVVPSNITINNTTVFLEATDGKKYFKLDLELLHSVESELKQTMNSVGRMSLTLKKVEAPKKWERLLLTTEKLRQMHFWWDQDKKYRQAFKDLEPKPEVNEADNNVVTNSKTKKNKKSKSSRNKKNDSNVEEQDEDKDDDDDDDDDDDNDDEEKVLREEENNENSDANSSNPVNGDITKKKKKQKTKKVKAAKKREFYPKKKVEDDYYDDDEL